MRAARRRAPAHGRRRRRHADRARSKRLEAAIRRAPTSRSARACSRDPSVSRQVRLHRKLSGDVFNFLVRRLGRRAASRDTQCGFKLFRGAGRRGRSSAQLTHATASASTSSCSCWPAPRLPDRGGAGQLGRPAGLARSACCATGPRMLCAGPGRAPPPGADAGRRTAAVTSRRSQEIEPFLAVEVFQRAQELERAGHRRHPPRVRRAGLRHAARHPRGGREGAQGRPHPLRPQPRDPAAARGDRRALPRALRRDGVARADPRDRGHLARHAAALRALLDPGDEVLLTDPYYAVLPELRAAISGGVPVYVPV